MDWSDIVGILPQLLNEMNLSKFVVFGVFCNIYLIVFLVYRYNLAKEGIPRLEEKIKKQKCIIDDLYDDVYELKLELERKDNIINELRLREYMSNEQ